MSQTESKTQVAHTPIPWSSRDFGYGIIIEHFNKDGWGNTIAETKFDNSSLANAELRANAELIVKAVNSHQAMYEALRYAVSEIEAFYLASAEGRIKTVVSVGQFQRLQKAKAALRLAEAGA